MAESKEASNQSQEQLSSSGRWVLLPLDRARRRSSRAPPRPPPASHFPTQMEISTLPGNTAAPRQIQRSISLPPSGNPGLSGTVNNSAIALMAALGQCQSLTASTFINVNEVTTIASIYELRTLHELLRSGGFCASRCVEAHRRVFDNRDLGQHCDGIDAWAHPQPYSRPLSLLQISIAPCINSSAPNSSPCTGLFALATPPGGTSPATHIRRCAEHRSQPDQQCAGTVRALNG